MPRPTDHPDAPKALKLIRTFRKEAANNMGRGWPTLGPDLQHALICERAVSYISSQDEDNASEDFCTRLMLMCTLLMQESD